MRLQKSLESEGSADLAGAHMQAPAGEPHMASLVIGCRSKRHDVVFRRRSLSINLWWKGFGGVELPPEYRHRNGSMAQQGVGVSPFLRTPSIAAVDSLAILHLKRDSLLPITLRSASNDGYAEGAVTNTRFGSFPHSTLIGKEWGSQVRASKVDTGTRGRKKKQANLPQESGAREGVDAQTSSPPNRGQTKRKSDETSPSEDVPESPAKRLKQPKPIDESESASAKAAIEAGSGFVHILPPTPETWTASLDHRTQVVYTPDYSYILQRLRVRPGSTILEAGAGSGSFTHAAARAVFNGLPSSQRSSSRRCGKVYSYEYHEARVETLRQELLDHRLDEVVHLTHRDVCNDGFAITPTSGDAARADAIFLDLPAPWLALKHLTRSVVDAPINAEGPVHLCTFSPCIEQVTSTVSFLRKNDWTEIAMCAIQNKRIDVRRERVGLKEEGLRGVNASAATVEEAITRLREVEDKLNDFHSNKTAADGKSGEMRKIQSKAERLEKIKHEAESRKLFKEGNLVHRTEPEVKTHTSYLVFATLPRLWSAEDERRCSEQWPVLDTPRERARASTKTQKK